jgi:AraC-like DNA-binding protein
MKAEKFPANTGAAGTFAELRRMNAIAVTRHESALGVWTQTQWKPAPGSPLAGAVDRVWHFDGTLGAARERVFPDGTLELIVQLDTPHRPGLDAAAGRFPPLCVTGLRTTAEVVAAPPGHCRVLGVRLSPPAAFRLLNAALPDLASLTIDLHAAAGYAAAELGARVHAARDGVAAVRTAAAWTARRIACGPAAEPAVQRALGAIVGDGGTRSIAALDAWQGRSRARFGAAFRDRVGVSPKRFARIVRFNRALDAIARGNAALGEIALAAGYYDQAHFTTEFRAHAGLTPATYLRAMRYPGTTSLVDAAAEQFFQDTAR